jgi:hypothetical protein
MEEYLMPKFGPVAPIQVLEGLFAHDTTTFGDYHLLLAHHTVAHSKRFRDLFEHVGNVALNTGKEVTVIMDNSIVELGDAVDMQMISDAVNAISFPGIKVYPVLPDVMGEGDATRRAVDSSYDAWHGSMPGEGFMAVCQGENYQDYLESLHYMVD